MQKEMLKPEYIVKDLCQNERLRYGRSQFRLMPGILLMVIAVLTAVFLSIWIGAALGLIAAVLLGQEGRNYLHYRKIIRSIYAGQYTVTSETLTGCAEEDVRNSDCTYQWQARYVLRFGSEDYCIIGNNYAWSRNFQLGYDGMVNTSVIGDEFWIVRTNETQEIGVVYNKKFFDYNAS